MRKIGIIMIAITLAGSPAAARDCVDYGDDPAWVGSVATSGPVKGIAVVGDVAFVTVREFGLRVVDIADPANPRIIGGADLPPYPTDVVVVDGHAFVTGAFSGLHVYDVADPADPRLVGFVDTPNYPAGLAVADGYAYIAEQRLGLQVIDVSDLANPRIVGTVDTPGLAFAVAVAGDYAYVGDHASGLLVVDVSAPASPRIVAAVDTPGYAMGVTIAGHIAYVAHRLGGLQVIDIAVPTDPRLVGSATSAGDNVAVVGGYAYATGTRLEVIDVSEPESPRLVGGVVTHDYAWDVAVAGGCAFVSGERGLIVVPLQCDEQPVAADIDVMPGNAVNPINCRGNPGVIAVALLTTEAFDALDADHTTVRFGPGAAAAVHAAVRHEQDVDHDGDVDLLFHFARDDAGIACGDTEAVLAGLTYDGRTFVGSDGIRTVPDREPAPDPAGGLAISPNPFNPSTTVAFFVERPQQVRVGVYDVRGRLVARLADQAYPAGRHAVRWRGCDDRGGPAPSGVYFFRVETAGRVEVRKAMLTK